MPANSARPTRPPLVLVLVATLSGTALAALVHSRPDLGAQSWARGDDLALAVAWGIAVAAAAWLFVVTGACVFALGCSRPRLARHCARILPFGIRRLVEVAIVTAVVAVPAVPAFATPPPSVVTVVVADEPVVRTVTTAPTSTIPGPPITRRSPTRTPVRTTVGHNVVVRPGDNLWLIARVAVTETAGRLPTDAEVAHYWRAVITANQTTLRSGNPSLIFPGEIVTLPPA